MTTTVDRDALIATLSALAEQPHEDGLARVTFAEISELQPIADLIKNTILGRPATPDADEEFLRAELLDEQFKFIGLTVRGISDHYHHGPSAAHVSATFMRRQLDDVSAMLLRDLALYGLFAYMNREKP